MVTANLVYIKDEIQLKLFERTDLQYGVINSLKTEMFVNLKDIMFSDEQDVSKVFDILNVSKVFDILNGCGFISITPPLGEPPMLCNLTLDSLSDYRNGSSIKPGNIRLNMRKLIEAVPEIVSIGAGMTCDNLVVIVCGALSLWNKLKSIATIDINKEQAFVIVALWRKCNLFRRISLGDGFVATNDLLGKYGETEITSAKFNKIIDSLIKLQCVELYGEVIWLRERISAKYLYRI
jgi:hypothetical protein